MRSVYRNSEKNETRGGYFNNDFFLSRFLIRLQSTEMIDMN